MRRSKRKASKNTTTATTSAAAVHAVTISNLPNHSTCDILSRLPLNSIFACKRVCKTWRDLTLEPYFAKLHLSRSPLSLISYHNGKDNNNSPSFHFEILQLHDPPVLGRRDATMKFRTEFFFPHMYVVASCNGSILLSNFSPIDDRIIIVCNPLRAQHFILPKPPKLALETYKSVRLGFGHSPRTDQYKVLRFTYTYRPDRLYLYFDIFTIGIDDEWRSIVGTEQPPGHIISNSVFLNGALHWIGNEKARFISYFDIEKEQFGSFPCLPKLEKVFTILGL
ncbi:F-box/kelch-repeat protein At3g17530-like [Rhododendron vialii]|uniref:F-box/kelch-repeat protein At3g17530-like n=1 Tax=Rhododendron vialii TaxID=182163 RepID=UPI00265DED8E|nr:F-box/kelch-repeat protein At3g17530-like [Rhododendron vialii]XP_058210509.1 F-box/kelch-repeat protein At3g17530-like [Rhododendron vialii]XP_058210511.1 F-box/kelch-repeat protein At3g17530-like [Rhododendron vialii]